MVPRASLDLDLVCDDGGELPESADVEVHRAVQVVGGIAVGVADEAPAHVLESRRIGANGRLSVGPLDRGAFEVAVRPAGFDRWTWAFEAHDRSSALALGLMQTGIGLARFVAPAIAWVPY